MFIWRSLSLLLLFSTLAPAQSTQDLYEVWAALKESEATFAANSTGVSNVNAKARDFGQLEVTYGAEKEGSSSKIIKLLGPDSDLFGDYVDYLSEKERRDFLIEFLDGFAEGRYRERNVKDFITGEDKSIALKEFLGIDYQKLSLAELRAKFGRFLELSENRPFSFLPEATRRKIFLGKFPGVSRTLREIFMENRELMFRSYGYNGKMYYRKFSVNFGQAQKYISKSVQTGVGWELLFIPQRTYGEFEEMVEWFRKEMGDGVLYEAPGHNRIVYPLPELAEDAMQVFDEKMKEIYKSIQAYIVLKETQGKTGLESSAYKAVFQDELIDTNYKLRRGSVGVLRLENGLWGKGTFGVEIRSGSKSARTQRFVHQVITSRVVSKDFSGIADFKSYTLIPNDLLDPAELARRFDLDPKLVDSFFDNFERLRHKFAQRPGRLEPVPIPIVLPPLYFWENAPYITPYQATQIKDISRKWIQYIALNKNLSADDFRSSLQQWARSTNIQRDIEKYLSPVFSHNPGGSPDSFPLSRSARTNVNAIDLGIEYSGRFPIKFQGMYTDRLEHGKKEWIQTSVDLTPKERRAYIYQVAQDLKKRLNPEGVIREVVADNAHGHGLSIVYEFEDAQGRPWRLEWDGIGRSYDQDGGVVKGSARGGHIELVTPKFQPSYEEVEKVFEAFNENGIIPSSKLGGGHINVDLDVFKGNPKKLARFLALFHQHRGVMAMMFQDFGRYKNAEPVEVSKSLQKTLIDFSGNETELKQLLYNERYFNQRVGRKTRYVQLDLSAYFQDVIPAEFIHADFDISNPSELWREQFRVNPEIRKLEFRMFNAPRSAYESALQIKFVRALLNKALNDDGPVSSVVQNVDYEDMAKNPRSAYKLFEKTCADLGLDPAEYKLFMSEGLSETKLRMRSKFYQSHAERLALHPKVNTWKSALKQPRASANAISSQDRLWRNGQSPLDANGHYRPYVSQEAREHYARRLKAVVKASEKSFVPLSASFMRHPCSVYFLPAR